MADRLSQPTPFDGGLLFGGVGVLPRRQQDPILSGVADAALRLGLPHLGGAAGAGFGGAVDPRFALLSYFAQTVPLRLLRIMLAQDGTAQMAAGIEAALAFGAGKVRFVAVKDWRTGRGVIDVSGTAEIERVYSLYQAGDTRAQTNDVNLPGGIVAPSAIPAGLPMLLHAADRLNDTGQVCFEATGDVGTGVTGIYDFDPLYCRYRDAKLSRPDARHATGERRKTIRVFEQQQDGAKPDARTGAVEGWRVLGGPGIASISWKGSTDNPYGGPRNGAALAYLLRKTARRRDLGDWLHNVAWPKVIIEQAVSAMFALVTEHPELLEGTAEDGGNLDASEWVAARVQEITANLTRLSSDSVWVIGEGKAYTVNPSDISGLTDVFKMERIEEIQSLNMLPSLVGVTDGGTQAYAEVQWLAEVQTLALLSAYSSAAPVQLGNYHFRLLGEDLVVRAEFDDLPPLAPQASAAARQTINAIEEHLAAIGVNSSEDLALRLSGTGANDPKRLEDYLQRLCQSLAQMSPPVPVPGAA